MHPVPLDIRPSSALSLSDEPIKDRRPDIFPLAGGGGRRPSGAGSSSLVAPSGCWVKKTYFYIPTGKIGVWHCLLLELELVLP